MELARVQGSATATMRHPSLKGERLVLCRFLDAAQKPTGEPVLAVDRHGVGLNDLVMLSSDGKRVREILEDNTSPVRWFTLGLVDAISGVQV